MRNIIRNVLLVMLAAAAALILHGPGTVKAQYPYDTCIQSYITEYTDLCQSCCPDQNGVEQVTGVDNGSPGVESLEEEEFYCGGETANCGTCGYSDYYMEVSDSSCCGGFGSFCSYDADCCSAYICLSSGQCGYCSDLGHPCGSDYDCCDYGTSCYWGYCCLDSGQSCNSDFDCGGGYCDPYMMICQ